MSFWKKLVLYLIITALSVIFSSFENLDRPIVISFWGYEFLIHSGFLLFALGTIIFVIGVIRAFIKSINKILNREKRSSIKSSMNETINILLTGCESQKLNEKDLLLPVKCAALCSQQRYHYEKIPMERFKEFPILLAHLKKRQIEFQIKSGQIEQAIKTLDDFLEQYPKLCVELKEELLELKTLSIRTCVQLKFDPTRHKQHLTSKFVFKYSSISDFELAKREEDQVKKLSLLEKAFNADKTNLDIVKSIVELMMNKQYKERDIVDIIEESFTKKPSRKIADVIETLNKKNAFEIAQKVSVHVSNDNLEKMWLLCTVACYSGLNAKSFEIFSELIKVGNIDELCKFYIQHYVEFLESSVLRSAIKSRYPKDEQDKDKCIEEAC